MKTQKPQSKNLKLENLIQSKIAACASTVKCINSKANEICALLKNQNK